LTLKFDTEIDIQIDTEIDTEIDAEIDTKINTEIDIKKHPVWLRLRCACPSRTGTGCWCGRSGGAVSGSGWVAVVPIERGDRRGSNGGS
jgi:hypothetical protein